MEGLVSKIKQLQRSNPKFKEAWIVYCDSDLGGVRDPNRHDAETLQEFLDVWAAEGEEAAAPPAKLVEKIKALQRSSPRFKKAWMEYCDAELGGTHDPARHDESTLAAFLESWEAEGEGEVFDEPPAELVERIKKVQRSSPEGRQAWIDFCDESHGGVHDPSRHEAFILRDFLKWWKAEGQAAEKAGGAVRPKAAAQKPAPTSDRVDFVTKGARTSAAFKAAWGRYCQRWGQGFSNPAKYDEDFLGEFVEYVAQLVHADLASGDAVAEPAAPLPQKRPAPGEAAGQKDAKKKLTLKKSVFDKINKLNAHGQLQTPIRPGAVAAELSELTEENALQILSSLPKAGVANPNTFICNKAKELKEEADAWEE